MNCKFNLNDFIDSLDKEEFEQFYRTHSNKIVLKQYNINVNNLRKILSALNIKIKTKEEINKIISNTFLNKSDEEKELLTKQRLQTRSKWSDEYKEELSKKQSEIRKNFTEEQKKHQVEAFKNTQSSKTPEQRAIEKSHRSEATKLHYQSLSEDEKKSFSEKMKQVYAELPDDVKENRKNKIRDTYRKTCRERYGVDNMFQLEEIKKKQQETLRKRYGVEWACQLPQCKLSGNNSLINLLFQTLLNEADLSYIREFNIFNFSYDFRIDDNLIEINPTPTHNSTWSPFPNQEKDKDYHYNKSKVARDNGYRCICIWDWDDSCKIIELLKNKEKVFARKCIIKEVSINDSKSFINQYHLQGYVKSEINIGLYFNDELISIMTFGKPRYNKNYEYELIRYCSSKNIVGGAEKLFNYFIKTYNPKSIISYCDWSKFNGDVYLKLGFKYKSYSIGKHWYNIKTKRHITDNLLRQRGFDQLFGKEYGCYGKGTSNEQLMLEHNFVEIYDCGQAVYEWIIE